MLECVLELIALEDVVVVTRLVGRSVLGVDGPSDGPQRARPALDPKDNPLVHSSVIEPPEDAFGESARGRLSPHGPEDTIAPVALNLSNLLRSPFSFLFARSSQEDRVASYVIREHERGRTLLEILEDPYVRNRLTPQQTQRLLDRPEVVHAIGDETIESTRRVFSTRV